MSEGGAVSSGIRRILLHYNGISPDRRFLFQVSSLRRTKTDVGGYGSRFPIFVAAVAHSTPLRAGADRGSSISRTIRASVPHSVSEETPATVKRVNP